MLDGRRRPAVGRGVEVAERVRAHEPLVARARHEVRLHSAHVERQGAERLGGVHHQRRPRLPGPGADPREIEEPAVGPVDVRQRDHRHPLVEFGQHRPRPVAVLGARDEPDLAARAPRLVGPGVDVRGELLGGEQDHLPHPERHVVRGEREAVARRGGEGHGVGPRPEQFRPGGAQRLRVFEEVVDGDLPGARLPPEAGGPRLHHAVEHWRHVGAVQVGDIPRDVEEMPLGRDHGAGREAGVIRGRARRASRAPGGPRSRPSTRCPFRRIPARRAWGRR